LDEDLDRAYTRRAPNWQASSDMIPVPAPMSSTIDVGVMVLRSACAYASKRT